MKLVGHVLRADFEDTMKEVTFDTFTLEARGVESKRRSKPKQNWNEESFKEAHAKLTPLSKTDESGKLWTYAEDPKKAKTLVTETARNRQQLFEPKRNINNKKGKATDKQKIPNGRNSDTEHAIPKPTYKQISNDTEDMDRKGSNRTKMTNILA